MDTSNLTDRINYLRAVKTEVENAASPILKKRMAEYAARFGWEPENESWVWASIGDIGFIVVVNIQEMNAIIYAESEILAESGVS